HRIRWLDGPLYGLAPSLRDFGQRPLRRPNAHQIAARSCARGPDACRLRERARAPRWHHGTQAGARCLERDNRALAGTAHAVLTSLSCLSDLAVEGEPQLVAGYDNLLAVSDLAGKNHFGERILHGFLDHALQRARAIGRVPALFGEPVARAWLELDGDFAVVEKLLQPRDLDIDDASHLTLLQAMEQDDLVNAVQEFRPESRAHDCHHLVLDRIGVLSFRLVDEKISAQV